MLVIKIIKLHKIHPTSANICISPSCILNTMYVLQLDSGCHGENDRKMKVIGGVFSVRETLCCFKASLYGL